MSCKVEAGWTCSLNHPSVCINAICGNFAKNIGEVCEDGNKLDGKGCSVDCLSVLPGWNCTFNSTLGLDVCKEICGDGIVLESELCDDLNLEGCKEGCLESREGWICKNGNTT